MNQEKFWVLFSRKLAGEASGAELDELEQLIGEHPEWQYAIQNLGDLWNHEQPKDTMGGEDAYLIHLHRMKELGSPFGEGPVHESPVPPRSINRVRWYWAAALLILSAGGWLMFRSFDGSAKSQDLVSKEPNEISTRPGSKSRVQLPDGTVVLLNAGSKLTFNKDYGKGVREVGLTGEGYFDVRKMNGIPFIIHTSHINIKVLGTVFNVKAYPDDKRTETSLIRGSIEVTIKNRPNDKIILSPSEKLVVENGELAVARATPILLPAAENNKDLNTLVSINKLAYNPEDSTLAETLWTDNKLVFRDESFDEIAVRMERWYNVEIEISNEQLKDDRFSGIFENETVEQALEAIRFTVPFKYEMNGNKIIIH